MMRGVLAVLVAGGVIPLAAQSGSWELAGTGGFGFGTDASVTNPIGTATTGFQSGVAAGVALTQHLHRYISGEIRYTYRMNDLNVSGDGREATFDGQAHVVHYDVLFHLKERDHPVRPFLAAGGGVKLFRGTGDEVPYQPLGDYVLLSKTQQTLPMISFGGGTAVRLSDRMTLRVEVRDYLTPFPDEVIVPPPGSKVNGWLHDIVPLVSVAYVF